MSEKFYTKRDIAIMFGCTEACVSKWLQRGELASFKVGPRFVRISESQLQAFMHERESKYSKRTAKEPLNEV